MTDLFGDPVVVPNNPILTDGPTPLANRLRPKNLDELIGQDHLIKGAGPIARMLQEGRLSSLILWGPPGVGKTTLAYLLADQLDYVFISLSAIFSGVKDLKTAFDQAETHRRMNKQTLLFVDEIHRFNRAQQDGFLPYVERGIVTLIGATTENPSFELNGALLSRCQVLTLNRLDDQALEQLLQRAEDAFGHKLPLDEEARHLLLSYADGDGRFLLNLVEDLGAMSADKVLNKTELGQRLQKRAPQYDKSQEAHYNLISALHKSIRGSDPDAALYWFSRMLEGGEDPLYLARRLIRMASEDIGLADPTALMMANEAARTYERLGSPEGELVLAHAVIHMAAAPKSNAAYVAFKRARAMAKETGSLMPPKHILNAPTQMMKEQGYGANYDYDHDTEEGFSGQHYFPDELRREVFYQPTERGREKAIKERLSFFQRLREEKGKK